MEYADGDVGHPTLVDEKIKWEYVDARVLRRFDREPQSNFINSSLARSIRSVYGFIPRSSV